MSEPNQTNHLASLKIVEIGKLQAIRELIHVIERLDIYLTCHTSQNKKVDHIVGNLLSKSKCKCLSVI